MSTSDKTADVTWGAKVQDSSEQLGVLCKLCRSVSGHLLAALDWRLAAACCCRGFCPGSTNCDSDIFWCVILSTHVTWCVKCTHLIGLTEKQLAVECKINGTS